MPGFHLPPITSTAVWIGQVVLAGMAWLAFFADGNADSTIPGRADRARMTHHARRGYTDKNVGACDPAGASA